MKDVARDSEAQAYVRRIAQQHKYAVYKTTDELDAKLRESVVTWMTRRLRRKPRPRSMPEVIIDRTVSLNYGANITWHFAVEPGDRIRGRITSQGEYYTFDVWMLSERDWATWKNRPNAFKPDLREGIAFAIDKRARRRQTWYVVVKSLAWLGPVQTKVYVVRERT